MVLRIQKNVESDLGKCKNAHIQPTKPLDLGLNRSRASIRCTF